MSSDRDERMILDGIELSEDMPFYGNVLKFKELVSHGKRCIEEIESTDNVRIIVLETWLFIDFCIRELLISGLNLDRLNIDTFDLRSKLLPQNFRTCLNLIPGLRDAHISLPMDPQEQAVKMPATFLSFLMKQHSDFSNSLPGIVQEYYRKYAPELIAIDTLEQVIENEQIQYSRISRQWLEAVGRIDEDWKEKANRLNDARNEAAHSYDSARILQRMGYSGENAVTHLKKECIAILHDLIGISKTIEGEEIQPT